MKLSEVIVNLASHPEETFICVRRPWIPKADAVLVPFTPGFRIPETVKVQGFEYFLEVSIANEIIEDYLKQSPSTEKVVAFVIHYAEHDAFPEWASSP